MDIKHLKEFIQLFKESGLESMTIKQKNGDEVTLTAQRNVVEQHHQMQPPLREPPVARHIQEVPGVAEKPTGMTHIEDPHVDPKKCVKSPMVGTFYSSPSPESRAFISVGQHVKEGEPICIVEAMKVMNEIKSTRTGVVRKVLVEDGSPVEFGQPLFIVE